MSKKSKIPKIPDRDKILFEGVISDLGRWETPMTKDSFVCCPVEPRMDITNLLGFSIKRGFTVTDHSIPPRVVEVDMIVGFVDRGNPLSDIMKNGDVIEVYQIEPFETIVDLGAKGGKTLIQFIYDFSIMQSMEDDEKMKEKIFSGGVVNTFVMVNADAYAVFHSMHEDVRYAMDMRLLEDSGSILIHKPVIMRINNITGFSETEGEYIIRCVDNGKDKNVKINKGCFTIKTEEFK